MDNTSSAMNLEQIDQEITLHLQKIDSDLAYCFTKITKDIIPYVTQYGQTCEEISYSCAWLKEMFQQSANVQLVTDQGAESAGQVLEPRASLFPEVDNKLDNKANNKVDHQMDNNNNNNNNNNTTMDGFHTAEHPLGMGMGMGMGSDTDEMTQDSAMEKQRKKRKISLQIQQQFNSSSSSSSSSSSTNSTLHKDFQENSSPIKMNPVDKGTETNNTLGKEGNQPGPQPADGQPTVIHFNSNNTRR